MHPSSTPAKTSQPWPWPSETDEQAHTWAEMGLAMAALSTRRRRCGDHCTGSTLRKVSSSSKSCTAGIPWRSRAQHDATHWTRHTAKYLCLQCAMHRCVSKRTCRGHRWGTVGAPWGAPRGHHNLQVAPQLATQLAPHLLHQQVALTLCQDGHTGLEQDGVTVLLHTPAAAAEAANSWADWSATR
jgi:hypothetical protein